MAWGILGGGWLTYTIQTVCESRRCRFVDYPQDIQTGDGARVFGSLSLLVVEIRWDGDHSIYDSIMFLQCQ